MDLDHIFDTKLMVMGHILLPKPIQGCTHTCSTGHWKPQGAPCTLASVDGQPLELAGEHPAGGFRQGDHERRFNEKCMTPEDNDTVTNQ